jgi:DNA repair protein RadC
MRRVTLDVPAVLRPVLELGGAALILVHNHVEGSMVRPVPSTDDVAFTRALCDGARTVGIELIDHLLIGRNGAVSSVLGCMERMARQRAKRTATRQRTVQ